MFLVLISLLHKTHYGANDCDWGSDERPSGRRRGEGGGGGGGGGGGKRERAATSTPNERSLSMTTATRHDLDLDNERDYGVVTKPDAIRFERVFPGPIERVWSYFNEPDKVAKWLATPSSPVRDGATVGVHLCAPAAG